MHVVMSPPCSLAIQGIQHGYIALRDQQTSTTDSGRVHVVLVPARTAAPYQMHFITPTDLTIQKRAQQYASLGLGTQQNHTCPQACT